MSTDVIGSRYRLRSVVTCTPESTTWDATDTWLDARVLVVTPEPGWHERFAELAGAVLDRSSTHLVGLYDIGATTEDFVVFGVPAATLTHEQTPREEEDVLEAGRALGDALESLHERGVVHGDLHPGAIVLSESGAAALSPWPLAPRPHNWSGPGGFGSGAEELHHVSERDDVHALGAVLLGALAGSPVLSSEQVGNVERELAWRAPHAVAIADRALTPPARGGYAVAAELRDDCVAVLAGQPIASAVSDDAAIADTASAGATVTERSEGRRAAMVLAASGAAVLVGFGVAGPRGAGPHPPVRPVAAHGSVCGVRPAGPRCGGTNGAAAPTSVAVPPAGDPARFADNPVAVSSPPAPRAPSGLSPSTPATGTTPTGPPPSSTTTTAPTTTTSTPPSTTTSTSTSTTTTSTAPTTSTTAPPATTTTSPSAVQAGTSRTSGSVSAPSPDGGSGGGPTQGPVH